MAPAAIPSTCRLLQGSGFGRQEWARMLAVCKLGVGADASLVAALLNCGLLAQALSHCTQEGDADANEMAVQVGV